MLPSWVAIFTLYIPPLLLLITVAYAVLANDNLYYCHVGSPDILCKFRTSRILTGLFVVDSCLRPSGLMGEVYSLVLGWQTQCLHSISTSRFGTRQDKEFRDVRGSGFRERIGDRWILDLNKMDMY